MDPKTKLVKGFKRYRDAVTKEKTSGWQFKVRVYTNIINKINNYEGEITGSDNFKGIKGIGPSMLEKIDKILAEEDQSGVEMDEVNTKLDMEWDAHLEKCKVV